MPVIGPNLGVPGPGPIDRTPKRPGGRVKAKDEAVTAADSVELEDPVRTVKGNEHEESAGDHQQGGGAYTSKGKKDAGARGNIDLNG